MTIPSIEERNFSRMTRYILLYMSETYAITTFGSIFVMGIKYIICFNLLVIGPRLRDTSQYVFFFSSSLSSLLSSNR